MPKFGICMPQELRDVVSTIKVKALCILLTFQIMAAASRDNFFGSGRQLLCQEWVCQKNNRSMVGT